MLEVARRQNQFEIDWEAWQTHACDEVHSPCAEVHAECTRPIHRIRHKLLAWISPIAPNSKRRCVRYMVMINGSGRVWGCAKMTVACVQVCGQGSCRLILSYRVWSTELSQCRVQCSVGQNNAGMTLPQITPKCWGCSYF